MTTLSQHPLRRLRLDPVILAAMLVLFAIVGWMCLPMAAGALGNTSDESGARIDLTVPVTVSMTPGWQSGDSSVRLPDLMVPGVTNDATSTGWRLTSNWTNGYEVRIRSTSEPALRGSNSVDGKAARDSFANFAMRDASGACPCPWTNETAKKGVFGYSVSVASSNGGAALDATRWGTGATRKWRGLDKNPYRAYATPGGPGTYDMTLHLRTEVPDGAVQVEGSYRASVVVSTHPLL